MSERRASREVSVSVSIILRLYSTFRNSRKRERATNQINVDPPTLSFRLTILSSEEGGRVFGGDLANLTDEMLLAAVQAAHARSKPALAHVTSRLGAHAAVEAGADGLAHVFVDDLPDEMMSGDAAERGVFLIATLTYWQGVFESPSGAEFADDMRFVPYLHPSALENLVKVPPMAGRVRGSFENALGTVRRFHEAGVVVLAGTDVTNAGTAHGLSIHREMELLVRAGLTPTEALAAATSKPAEHFGLNDRGRIAPGLRADLLLVRGDPTVDIRATREIVAVIRGGTLVDREALADEVVSTEDPEVGPDDDP